MSTIEITTKGPVVNLTDRATAKVAELIAREPPSTTRTASRATGSTSRTPTPSAPAAAGSRSREA